MLPSTRACGGRENHLVCPVHGLCFRLWSHRKPGRFPQVFVESRSFPPPTFPEYPKSSPGKTTLLSIGQGKLKQLLYLTKNTSCCHDNLCSKIRNASHSGVAAIKESCWEMPLHPSVLWRGARCPSPTHPHSRHHAHTDAASTFWRG